MFKKNPKLAAQSDKEAGQQAKKARAEARKGAAYEKSLKSGKSGDPAADRYMIRQHDSARRIADANAKDAREMARQARRRIW